MIVDIDKVSLPYVSSFEQPDNPSEKKVCYIVDTEKVSLLYMSSWTQLNYYSLKTVTLLTLISFSPVCVLI